MPDKLAANAADFRKIIGFVGLAVAIVTFGGVIAVIRSKYLSWQEYKKFYDEFKEYFLPQPLAGKALHWGVNTTNTWLSLMPDVLLPFIFFVAWLFVVTLT